MNLLILEDNEIQQRILRGFFNKLTRPKIKIFIKKNGKEGLDFIKSTEKKIDLIFTDVKMPVMDGIKFCNKVRETDKSTPIILMTANYEQHNSRTVQNVNNFIIKPFNFGLIGDIVYKYSKQNL